MSYLFLRMAEGCGSIRPGMPDPQAGTAVPQGSRVVQQHRGYRRDPEHAGGVHDQLG